MVEIKMLKANNGDCFIIKYKDTNILIDGGVKGVYAYPLKNELEILEKIDLVVITHVDFDHIGGIIELFEDDEVNKKVKKVFFNSGATLIETEIEEREIPISSGGDKKGYKHGITLEKKLLELGIWDKELITDKTEDLNLGPINIKVLGPFKENIEALNKGWDKEIEKTKKNGSSCTEYENIKDLVKKPEDIKTSIINKSSIVLLIEIEGKKLLFTGDTSSDNLVRSLRKLNYSIENPIKLDLFKLPHHGSKKNLSKELVEMIDCSKYLISTNGSYHNHPDKETLARIIDFNKDKNIELIFNYDIYKGMFSREDEDKYKNFSYEEAEAVNI